MKNLILLLVATISFGLGAQSYTNVPGTRVSMVPPAGFVPSPGFVGFEKNEDAGIQITDLFGGSFDSNAKDFTQEGLKRKGVELLEFTTLKIDGFPARYAHVRQLGVEKLMLAFGDSDFSVMALGIIVKDAEKLAPQIKKSLLGIRYDKTLKIDPFAASGFSVAENGSKFKFAKASGNMFLFPVGGVDKKSYENESMVMVVSLPVDKDMSKGQMLETVVDGLVKQGMQKKKTGEVANEKISGYDAIQNRFTFVNKGKTQEITVAILIKDQLAIAFYGISETGSADDSDNFKKLLYAIKIK